VDPFKSAGETCLGVRALVAAFVAASPAQSKFDSRLNNPNISWRVLSRSIASPSPAQN
jgi:hypothetical protein